MPLKASFTYIYQNVREGMNYLETVFANCVPVGKGTVFMVSMVTSLIIWCVGSITILAVTFFVKGGNVKLTSN